MAREQTYDNHTHIPRLFGVGFLAWVVSVASFGAMVFGYRTEGVAIASLLVAVAVALAMGRTYITALQDRIIRTEMRLRCANLLNASQHTALAACSMKQIAALRFASNAELPALVERAAAERLTSDQIKRAVKDWQADWERT